MAIKIHVQQQSDFKSYSKPYNKVFIKSISIIDGCSIADVNVDLGNFITKCYYVKAQDVIDLVKGLTPEQVITSLFTTKNYTLNQSFVDNFQFERYNDINFSQKLDFLKSVTK